MADAHAAQYGWGPGTETDRQSFPLEIGNPDVAPYGGAGSGSGTDGLGDYRALNAILPPPPGPRAADVWAAGTHAVQFPPRTGSWPEPQPTYFGVEG